MLSAFIIGKMEVVQNENNEKKSNCEILRNGQKLIETFGELFEVDHKEKNVLRLVSLQKPYFGVVAVVPCKDCKLVEE